jgi:hypothetical protein
MRALISRTGVEHVGSFIERLRSRRTAARRAVAIKRALRIRPAKIIDAPTEYPAGHTQP